MPIVRQGAFFVSQDLTAVPSLGLASSNLAVWHYAPKEKSFIWSSTPVGGSTLRRGGVWHAWVQGKKFV